MALVCLHAAAMLYRFGAIPNIPVFGDEIVINDPAVALSRGHGLIAPSFTDSVSGLDKLYAHFPPVYIYLQAAIFHTFGVSAYSLRILTLVFSIASVAVFFGLAYRLRISGRMKRRTALFVTWLYALSAPVLILHRISRMESLIELLGLISLGCALRLTLLAAPQQDAPEQRPRRQVPWLLLAAVASGLALASHPEALTAVLPSAVIVLFAHRVSPRHKGLFFAVLTLTPVVIWVATYRGQWLAALAQMAYIARKKAPDPSMPAFGMDLLKKAASTEHDLMVFFFFSLTLVILTWALIQVLRGARSARAGSPTEDADLRSIEKGLATAVPVTFVILLFFLPASITRYEVFYPIYLLLIAVLPAPYTSDRRFRPYVSAAVGVLIVAQFLACVQYLAQNRTSAEGPAERYDFLLDCIPASAKVAASPQLWLAFERRDRHFTLLYPGLDGLENWEKDSSDPLGRFDVILVSDYIKEDFDRYARLSARSHREQDVRIGMRTLRVYSRSGGWLACTDSRLRSADTRRAQ